MSALVAPSSKCAGRRPGVVDWGGGVFASCSTIGSCRSTATFIIVKRGWSGFPVRRAITIRMLGFSFGLALVKCTKCYLMELPSLSYRRLRGDLIETFQYLHGIYRTNSSTVLPLAPTHDGTTRGHSLKLHKRECRTSLRANVLGFRIVNFWNSMPEDIVSAPSVNSFKGRFDKHYAHLRYCTEY